MAAVVFTVLLQVLLGEAVWRGLVAVAIFTIPMLVLFGVSRFLPTWAEWGLGAVLCVLALMAMSWTLGLESIGLLGVGSTGSAVTDFLEVVRWIAVVAAGFAIAVEAYLAAKK